MIEEFIGQYEKKSTQYGYSSALYSFFDYLYKGERSRDKSHYELLASQYLTEKRDYKQDLIDFAKSTGKPTKTIRMYISAISEFLKFNKINLDLQDKKDIRIKTPKKFYRPDDMELTIDSIRTILHHSDIKMKAIITMCVSSGMRINEVLSIKEGNITRIDDIARIDIDWNFEKKGSSRYTFISPEAVRYLDEWMKVRDKYISEKAVSADKRVDDGRIFPLERVNATLAFNNTLKRAGLYEVDPNTERGKIHFHLFRAFFISNLKLKISPEIVEFFVHTSRGDVNAIYRKYTKAQVINAYKEGMGCLVTDTDPVLKEKYIAAVDKIAELDQKQNVNSDNMGVLITTIHNLQADNKDLRQQIKDIGNEFAGIKAQLIIKKIIENPEHSL